MLPNHAIPPFIATALREVEAHTREFPQQEVCGLIVDGAAVRGVNVLHSPDKFRMDNATIDALDDALNAGSQVAIYHSHVSEDSHDDFSPEDMVNIYENGDIPWLLVDIRNGAAQFRYFDPLATLAYEEREWRWSCCNCYSLVRDWLGREMGVEIDPFILQSEHAWLSPEWDEFLENIEKQGFTKVDAPPDIKDVRTGDLILMRVGDAVNPNHIAVVSSAARNEILHHLQNSYSTITSYTPAKRKSTVGVYRHESLMKRGPR